MLSAGSRSPPMVFGVDGEREPARWAEYNSKHAQWRSKALRILAQLEVRDHQLQGLKASSQVPEPVIGRISDSI